MTMKRFPIEIKYFKVPYITPLSLYKYFKHIGKKEIFVQFGELAVGMKDFLIKKGTILEEFRDPEMYCSLRVNGEIKEERYVLQHGDIVTNIDSVWGG